MDILEAVRQLGRAIQGDERFLRYAKAKLANDNNESLQNSIGEFNITRMELDRAMDAQPRDDEKVRELNERMRSIYAEVMSSPAMIEYNESKSVLDGVLNEVNSVIMQCVEGADPDTVEPEVHSCNGSCEGCSGCH